MGLFNDWHLFLSVAEAGSLRNDARRFGLWWGPTSWCVCGVPHTSPLGSLGSISHPVFADFSSLAYEADSGNITAERLGISMQNFEGKNRALFSPSNVVLGVLCVFWTQGLCQTRFVNVFSILYFTGFFTKQIFLILMRLSV